MEPSRLHFLSLHVAFQSMEVIYLGQHLSDGISYLVVPRKPPYIAMCGGTTRKIAILTTFTLYEGAINERTLRAVRRSFFSLPFFICQENP